MNDHETAGVDPPQGEQASVPPEDEVIRSLEHGLQSLRDDAARLPELEGDELLDAAERMAASAAALDRELGHAASNPATPPAVSGSE